MFQVVGIDVGRDRVKAVSCGKKVEFKSRIGEWRERKLSTGGNYEVETDKKYFVANLADESYFVREMATESKIHIETNVLFLTALALLADQGVKTGIVTGLPVNQHTPEIKKQMTDLISGFKPVRVNGSLYNFFIDEPLIAPESGGAFWDNVLDEKGIVSNSWLLAQKVRVVDIGSRTVNYCTIYNKQYLDRDSGTLSYGVIELSNAGDSEALKEQFARRIVADLSKKWLNYQPKTDVILLTGGGAILLEKYLWPQFPLCRMATDPLFGNASGYYKMGVAKWQKSS